MIAALDTDISSARSRCTQPRAYVKNYPRTDHSLRPGRCWRFQLWWCDRANADSTI